MLSLGDLIIQGHDFLSVKFALGVLTVTGLVFACTLWSKVIADDDGITVRNPFRVFTIPWAAVQGIFLADSVEIQCARRSAEEGQDRLHLGAVLDSPDQGQGEAARLAVGAGKAEPPGELRPAARDRPRNWSR